MKYSSICLWITILLNVSLPAELKAQEVRNHVITAEELHQRLVAQSARRSQDIQDIQKLLRHDQVQAKLGNLLDLERIEVALATLDDGTLNDLASKSRNANDQIEAGMATWGWVVIALIAAITIIVVVTAAVVID